VKFHARGVHVTSPVASQAITSTSGDPVRRRPAANEPAADRSPSLRLVQDPRRGVQVRRGARGDGRGGFRLDGDHAKKFRLDFRRPLTGATYLLTPVVTSYDRGLLSVLEEATSAGGRAR